MFGRLGHSRSECGPALAAVIALAWTGPAFAQSGGGYDLGWNTIDGGGGNSSAGLYAMTGTIGQHDAGTMSGGTYAMAGGFWPGIGTAPPPPPITLVSANPPLDNPFVAGTQPFRDVLQTGTTNALTQGIGATGTPAEDSISYGPLSVTFSGTPNPLPAVGNVSIACTGGTCPTVTGVTGSGAGPYLVSLSGAIPPGHCTTLTFAGAAAGQKLQYQYLPGDAGMNGSASPLDVQQLVAALSNGQAQLPANRPRYDINRNGVVSNTDVLRLIQLLIGTNTTQQWVGVSVAACP